MNTSFEPKSQAPTQHNSKRENQNSKAYPSRTIVHAKLEMTEPGDHDEQEADAVANTIVSGGKIARKISSGGSSSGIAVSQQMESQLSQLQGGGRPMPQGLLSMMENGFGQDFSQVRLHTDSEAASMSSSIHAKAFTHGNDIYFNRGQFAPETAEGQCLVAHELTHVVQGTGKVGRETNGEDKYAKRIHRTIGYYIKELGWVKNYVLNDSAYAKLVRNYDYDNSRSPVTVLIYTNELSARHEKEQRDPNVEYAYEDRLSLISINGLILNMNKKVLMIQGSPNYYGHKLIDIFYSYGPIENVLIIGHGSSDSVQIDKNYSIASSDNRFFNNVRYAFNMSDKEIKGLKHSFLLPDCLTGSDFNTEEGLVNNAFMKLNKGRDGKSIVFVRGNIPSIYSKFQKYYIDDDYLKFYNTIDPKATIDGKHLDDFSEALSSYNNSDQEAKPYASEGKQFHGIIKSLTHINSNNHEAFCRNNNSLLLYDLDENGNPRNEQDHKYFGDEETLLKIREDSYPLSSKDFVQFIDSKHCNISSDNDYEGAIEKIKKLLEIMIKDEELDFINYTPSNIDSLLESVYNSI